MTTTTSRVAPSAGDALSIERLSKRFGGALALDDVSLRVSRGEVHGLLGSNGSGKSTLIKVLAGFHTPEPGADIRLYDQPVPLPIPGAQVREMGLAFVHQNLGLIPSLSVTENLFLGELSTQANWAINWSDMRARAASVFSKLNLSLDPAAMVAELSAVEQALLAIARAHEDLRVATADHTDRPGVLVLDEPTPFLPRAGVDQLFALIRQCTDTGASVVFVSHDIAEVREITDRATILRDGRLVDTVDTARTEHDAFVERIIGRSMLGYAGTGKTPRTGAPSIHVEGLLGQGIGPVDLSLSGGEILGLTGLIGSGYDVVPALLCGARADAVGTLALNDTRLALADVTPGSALEQGIAYLPADRLGAAGVGGLSVADNIGLPVLQRLKGPLGLTTTNIETHAGQICADAGVKPNAPALPLAAFSGGNAQKALVAKWLQTDPVLLLLDEPTQGVDVGARQQIWDALDQTCAKGAAILVASTDYEQLAQICHRVLIMARGQIVATLTGDDLTKDSIAEHCYRSLSRIA